MSDWFLGPTQARDWAAQLCDDLGPVLDDVVAVLGPDAPMSWEGAGQEPGEDNDEWPAWCATLVLAEGERPVTLVVAMDHAAFDDDDIPIRNRFVVEVAVVFGLEPRQQLPAALRRATAAWDRCRTLDWAPSPHPYPNREEAPGATVTLFTEEALREFDPPGVWVAVRSKPFWMRSRAEIHPATAAAVATMLPKMREWESAMHLVRGAVFGVAPTMDLPTIIGWCGEALFWQREGARRYLVWSPAWTAPYDFNEGDDRLVEVKTGDVRGGGTLHFSAEEVALALEARDRYSLVQVRIDTSVAGRIRDALTGAPVPCDPEEDAWGPEGVRLALAIGKPSAYVRERWAPIRDILFGLDAEMIEKADPFAWLAPLAGQVSARRVGLVLPARP